MTTQIKLTTYFSWGMYNTRDCLYLYSICGTLHSVDQFLNIKLTDISITDPDKYPHMV